MLCADPVLVAEAKPSPDLDAAFEAEVIWERHSSLVETIECGIVGDVAVMKRKDFMAAVAEIRAAIKKAETR